MINKDKYYLYILPWSNYNGVYYMYEPLDNYDICSLYFHWDILESDNYVCEMECVLTNNKPRPVLMKVYGLNDVKLFRLDKVNQHCKFWFTNDGMNIIPL
jgi:hypothetical protein